MSLQQTLSKVQSKSKILPRLFPWTTSATHATSIAPITATYTN